MVTTSSASQGSCTQECLPRCNAVTLNSFLLKAFIHGPILPSLEVKVSYHIYTPSFCSSVERDELFILRHSAVANDTSFPSPFVSHASMLPSPVASNASGRSTSVPETAESAPDDISIPAFALLACASKLEPVNVTGGAEALKVS
jgi:hypothetical protein